MMNSTEKSLPEKLSDDIIAYILEEQLQPNDKLPNESVLSEKMGAGRSSIREAMKLLASRNIVTIRQGSGTYVAASPGVVDDPLGFTFIDDKKKLTLDLLDVRFLLEPAIAEMAALHAEETDIRKISTLCDEVEALLLRGEDHTGKDIEYVLKNCKVEDRQSVLMVGDREHDILGAKACKVSALGVLYGYGDRAELEDAGADWIVSTPAKITEKILGRE